MRPNILDGEGYGNGYGIGNTRCDGRGEYAGSGPGDGFSECLGLGCGWGLGSGHHNCLGQDSVVSHGQDGTLLGNTL
jgi:hypothetical protein